MSRLETSICQESMLAAPPFSRYSPSNVGSPPHHKRQFSSSRFFDSSSKKKTSAVGHLATDTNDPLPCSNFFMNDENFE